jgi:hypothetical protein
MNTDTSMMKLQARRLRQEMNDAGMPVSHSRSLELVARMHGWRDWNTARGSAPQTPTHAAAPVELGGKVAGRYLGHPFRATVTGVQALAGGAHWRVQLRIDEPVDVVAFEGFSALRSRLDAIVNAAGRTAQKTSDGQPHLALDLKAA